MRRLLCVLLTLAALGVLARGVLPCGAVPVQAACYVVLHPGPVEDTLGLVRLGDTRTYAASGQLLLTTVAVDTDVNVAEWVGAVFSPRTTPVPRSVVFPPGSDDAEARRQNAVAMDQSQVAAAVAALRSLGHAADVVPGGAEVVEVPAGSPAAGVLRPGDVVVEAGGAAVTTAEDLVAAIRARQPGDTLTLRVLRDGAPRDVEVRLRAGPGGGAVVGALVSDHIRLPVDVRIDANEVGGPSAGLMFALAVVELLTPEDLTAGAVVAGTGTIDPEGNVGPIGGIHQKILGALSHRRPASVFLVPAANLVEARDAPVTSDVLLVPVTTLGDAIAKLRELREGRTPTGAVALAVG